MQAMPSVFPSQEPLSAQKQNVHPLVKTLFYLMDSKVGVGVKVVVSGGHLFRVEKLSHLATARAAGQRGCMWRVRRV